MSLPVKMARAHPSSGRAIRLIVCALLVALAFPLGAKPGGSGALPGAQDAGVWTVTAPLSAPGGDCVPVFFDSSEPLDGAEALLLRPDGKRVARARAFTVPHPGGPSGTLVRYRYCALLAIPSLAEPGNATISARATVRPVFRRPVFVKPAGGRARSPAGNPAGAVTGSPAGAPTGSPAEADVREIPFSVERKEFESESIRLDAKNTAIRTDASPARIEQIRTLNDILFSFRPEAARFGGPFRLPLDSKRRTATFGDRRVYVYNTGKKNTSVHEGIDFGVPKGTPVFSAGDGTVVLAASRVSTGFSVVVEHLPGVYSLYYHLDALTCAEGERVRAGTLLGRSGSTGLSTGPHLHFEFRVNGEAVSPDWFIGRDIF